MNSLSLFLKYARYRYLAQRVVMRIRLGKKNRDEHLNRIGLSEIDFLPERPYSFNGLLALPRKGSDDFYMFSIPREKELLPHLRMRRGETFVDVGANVGYYSLKLAKDYANDDVRIIAIEAHPENFKALNKNIELNSFECVRTINKAVSNHKGIATLYDRVDTRNRIRSEFYSLSTDYIHDLNFVPINGGSVHVECDTLDNILEETRVDVMKIDIEGGEVSALEGAGKTLERLRKLIVEVHGHNLEKVLQVLRDTDHLKYEIIETQLMKYVIGSRVLF
jgi:FkbM family methyltransferase